MTFLDRWLQKRRIKKAMPYIPRQGVLLDIGCHKGELFLKVGDDLVYGVGVDPSLEKDSIHGKYELLKDSFPSTRVESRMYHCITMLAVLEHIAPELQKGMIDNCYPLLHSGGIMILTVPDKKVDHILVILKKLRLIQGMNIEEHFGFDTSKIPELFANAGFQMVVHKKFQLGLNNLYVFKK